MKLHEEFEAAMTAQSFRGSDLTFAKVPVLGTSSHLYLDPLVNAAWVGYQAAMKSKRWRK